jgi:putative heme-binding domain-containing protein
MMLWLDASAQPAAAAANKVDTLRDGAALESWYDSSGHSRHARQPDEKARPTLRLKNERGFIRFEGRAACFVSNGLGPPQRDLTVFLVAAPAGNEGNFRALFCTRKKGEDDFKSGLNIDLGPYRTESFDTLNVEGSGIVAVQNLRTTIAPFLGFHRICVQSSVGGRGVTLHIDGQAEGTRGRTDLPIAMDELIIGARSYGGTQMPRGYFAGEIAEVMVFNRVLTPQERKSVDEYLAAKYRDVGPIPPLPKELPPGAIPRIDTPPLVQMLVPGFTVRELPVKLTNVNNVFYRDDGTLVALAYDGNIHLLTDADGDGLEESARLFWKNDGQLSAPIGMALTPPQYSHGQGVLVAAKSKCVLIVDTDGDDRADQEIVVADGWTELPHGVDALGATFDPKDQAIFFGLGTTNFTDPYLLANRESAAYRLSDERGTIVRVAPDLKSRQVFATGIRFPVAIRFNPAGDLFCTDQEGATWLSNGNPFDELLHVEGGRHYGFPPRHPRHLPNVIDEPSVYDYRPQHQSACGLNFNEPAIDGTIFGPEWWRSDAIVTGYSRGKLYRTKLARTQGGYVAQNQLVGSLSMLPADACIAPRRSLVIAAHSGGPDWGSGPGGKGKLFKIAYESADTPTPALVWPSGPQEVKIAFDRSVDPETLKGLASRAVIEGGEFVAAGDRLEFVRPGYVAVDHQQNAPRFGVEIQSVQLTADRRTLILSTAPHFSAVTYAVALRGIEPATPSPAVKYEVPQLPDIDLQYKLCGVEATWQPEAGEASTIWLPHLDLGVSRTFTGPSAEHAAFWQQLESTGTLVLRTSLNLSAMLRPAVQIGSTIDYEWPEENVTLTFSSNSKFDMTFDGREASATLSDGGGWTLRQTVAGSRQAAWPLEIRLQRQEGQQPSTFTIAFHTQEDDRARALALRRFNLPWAKATTESSPVIVDNSSLPELQGGDWLRGQAEFYGAAAGCGKCHAVGGRGAKIGPDLSNLAKRDYASVVRDITHPSFAINPDYITQNVVTTGGRVLSGAVRTEGDQLIVSNAQAEERVIARSDVEELEAAGISIMPEGIPAALGADRMRDLLTFLLVEPPSMPVYGEQQPPPPRKLREVEAVLAGAQSANDDSPLHVVLVAGPKDHGLGEHDYPAWQKAWRRLLEMDEAVRVTTAEPWPGVDDWKSAEVLVFYQQGTWTPERARDIDTFLRRGGGLVYIHYAVDGGVDGAGFAERIGLAWQGGRSKFRHGPLDVEFAPGSQHPIARNLDHVHFHDESYWNLTGSVNRVKLLATGVEEGRPQPLFWTHEPTNGGRVFVSIPGHFAWTFDDPIFRILLLRGIAWTADEPVDRFNELVFPGARIYYGSRQQ